MQRRNSWWTKSGSLDLSKESVIVAVVGFVVLSQMYNVAMNLMWRSSIHNVYVMNCNEPLAS